MGGTEAEAGSNLLRARGQQVRQSGPEPRASDAQAIGGGGGGPCRGDPAVPSWSRADVSPERESWFLSLASYLKSKLQFALLKTGIITVPT